MARVKRQDPPPVEHRAPLCPLCLEEVRGEDGWMCDSCDIYWSWDGDSGSWLNEDVEQCGGVKQPFLGSEHENIRTNEYRCLLDVDHKGDHRADGFIDWKRQY